MRPGVSSPAASWYRHRIRILSPFRAAFLLGRNVRTLATANLTEACRPELEGEWTVSLLSELSPACGENAQRGSKRGGHMLGTSSTPTFGHAP
eukprot:406469-Pyramimonas_sp.AAC.1